MTCREIADFMADYLEGCVEPAALATFECHLERCANCATYLAQYRATVALGRVAFEDPEAPPPSTVPEGIVRAILAARGR